MCVNELASKFILSHSRLWYIDYDSQPRSSTPFPFLFCVSYILKLASNSKPDSTYFISMLSSLTSHSLFRPRRIEFLCSMTMSDAEMRFKTREKKNVGRCFISIASARQSHLTAQVFRGPSRGFLRCWKLEWFPFPFRFHSSRTFLISPSVRYPFSLRSSPCACLYTMLSRLWTWNISFCSLRMPGCCCDGGGGFSFHNDFYAFWRFPLMTTLRKISLVIFKI